MPGAIVANQFVGIALIVTTIYLIRIELIRGNGDSYCFDIRSQIKIRGFRNAGNDKK